VRDVNANYGGQTIGVVIVGGILTTAIISAIRFVSSSGFKKDADLQKLKQLRLDSKIKVYKDVAPESIDVPISSNQDFDIINKEVQFDATRVHEIEIADYDSQVTDGGVDNEKKKKQVVQKPVKAGGKKKVRRSVNASINSLPEDV
jgi:hypothetical protein